MSEYLIQGETLTNIADSIRAKNGTTDTLTPVNMPTAIDNISTGMEIDGKSAEFRIANGVALEVGNFIELTDTYDVESNHIFTDYRSGYKPCCVALTNDKLLAFLGNMALIINIVDGAYSVASNDLSTYITDAKLLRLSEDKVLVVSSGSPVRVNIATINGNTITLGNSVKLGISSSKRPYGVIVDENTVFLSGGHTNTGLWGTVINIEGDAITEIPMNLIPDLTCIGNTTCYHLGGLKFLIAYSCMEMDLQNREVYYLKASVVDLSGESFTVLSTAIYGNSYNKMYSEYMYVNALDDGKILVTTRDPSKYLLCWVLSVNDNNEIVTHYGKVVNEVYTSYSDTDFSLTPLSNANSFYIGYSNTADCVGGILTVNDSLIEIVTLSYGLNSNTIPGSSNASSCSESIILNNSKILLPFRIKPDSGGYCMSIATLKPSLAAINCRGSSASGIVSEIAENYWEKSKFIVPNTASTTT